MRIWRALLHFCQAAEVQSSLCSPLGLICFHHIHRQGRGVFQPQTNGRRPKEQKCQKMEKPEALFRSGCSGLEAHRQAGHIFKVHLAACLARCLYGPQCWMCCLAYLSWSPSALFIEETPFLWGILPWNTPGSLFSVPCPVIASSMWTDGFSPSHGQCILAQIRNSLARYLLDWKRGRKCWGSSPFSWTWEPKDFLDYLGVSICLFFPT